RSHPEAHQGTPDHGPLHRDAAAVSPRGLPRRVRAVLVPESGYPPDLDQLVYATGGRAVGRTAGSGRSRAPGRRAHAYAKVISQAANAGRLDRGLRAATAEPG